MMLRDAHAADFPQILALNAESVHFLSPLTLKRLECLHGHSAYHRVAVSDGNVAAFLLAFREHCAYDSSNYQWFTNHYAKFLYIDRVVVSLAFQGHGLGHLLYQDLFGFAGSCGVDQVTCEFDIEPPNEISRRFHKRYGFAEVGIQTVASGKKRVSLQAVALQRDNSRPASQP